MNMVLHVRRQHPRRADRRAARPGGANGVAILLPLTFSMSPDLGDRDAVLHLLGRLFGGAITSVLFNIPGEPWSVATTFDGYPMAQKGRRRGADGGLHLVVRRRLRGRADDHLPGPAGGRSSR
jgi:hypothetical protein